MLNPWNDLIKQESNNNTNSNNSGISAVNPINMYTSQSQQNENDASSLMLMGGGNGGGAGNGLVPNGMQPGNGPNGLPSQAQVAAAVATAMMMQNNGHNK